MRYMGGKSRIAKPIVDAIRSHGKHVQGRPVLEPFCGGLGVTLALSSLGPVLCSDTNPSLIALYQGWQDGWRPPSEVTAEDYAAAKHLPDSSPLKAFTRYGVSFGGCGRSYARAPGINFAGQTARQLAKQVPAAFSFDCVSFFELEPRPGLTLYLDPPYQNTHRYEGQGTFDSAKFWEHANAWAAVTDVYVSEFAVPDDWEIVWSKERVSPIAQSAENYKTRTELLAWKGPK